MRVPLVDLLRGRSLCHPTRLISLHSSEDAALTLHISGFPWWLADRKDAEDGTITLQFEGVSSGYLRCEALRRDMCSEDLEPFDVQLLATRDWIKGPNCQVFCHASVPDPLAVYAALLDFLLATDCPHDASNYLNMGWRGSFAGFQEIMRSTSFKAVDGPESICQVVCDELTKQGVPLNVVRSDRYLDKGLWVRLGDSRFICDEAFAEFDE